MRSWRWALVPAIVATATSCFTSDSACTTGELPACTVAPSYSSEISPIIARQCLSCHSPGGVESTTPLVSYDDVHARRGPVLNQVYACLMPQGTALDPDERTALLTWLVCGAPNN